MCVCRHTRAREDSSIFSKYGRHAGVDLLITARADERNKITHSLSSAQRVYDMCILYTPFPRDARWSVYEL